MYNDPTVQYWAWKNVKADYVGHGQYRRFFNYNEHTSKYPRISTVRISDRSYKKFGWDRVSIERAISDCDVIVARKECDVRPGIKSIKDNYYSIGQPYMYDLTMKCIELCYPDYLPYAKKYFEQDLTSMFNMCIMKKDNFDNFSKWEFDILFKVEEVFSSNDEKSLLGDRVCGFIAEHLLNIYIMYQQEVNNWKIKELQTVMILVPEKNPTIRMLTKGCIKHLFTLLFPYSTKRRDIIKWKFFMK